ncbi:GTP 3',8-cyclase MoaA [uncultured Fusobacterium sp.]|uniref:GTP 3',8-cyclase MoaA n=1 Tax=uncultured Fusobacterium sp. TaxID=159267 RepID=UPI0025D2F99D|nr:GTP 3',8-cyclase MoaA [uncultured Fusobacterium sp.]
MKDSLGREIDYLRISLTESCNLRCIYCMPEGVAPKVCGETLTKENIFDIVEVAVELNIKKIRLTGGEPLLRQDIVEIIQGIKDRGIEKIYITTNGILLSEKIEKLKKAGLKGVNISLDTLDREQFNYITRGGDLERVLQGIEKALNLNLEVKINSVIMKDINENAIEELAKLTLNSQLDVRFIELMPIGQGKKFTGISNNDIYDRLEKIFEFDRNYKEIKGVSTYYKLKNSKGNIGFISPINSCFCETCNKIRLTSDGVIKRCLNSKGNTNIKEYLDKNVEKEEIKEILEQEIFKKPERHLFGKDNKDEELKNMNAIGG